MKGGTMTTLTKALRRIPTLKRVIDRRGFGDSGSYWDRRYRSGGDSGAGSYGRLAEFKAEVLNDLVEKHGLRTVIEFGVGDGAQLELANYPAYIGLDVSPAAVEQCRWRFGKDESKAFMVHDCRTTPLDGTADVTLSLDVVYHLVEDAVFEAYMGQLFDAADRMVVVYSSNRDEPQRAAHVRHRRFTDWVEANRPGWRLAEMVPNRYPESLTDGGEVSFADFYVYVPT
jgi:hypothetical protein